MNFLFLSIFLMSVFKVRLSYISPSKDIADFALKSKGYWPCACLHTRGGIKSLILLV